MNPRCWMSLLHILWRTFGLLSYRFSFVLLLFVCWYVFWLICIGEFWARRCDECTVHSVLCSYVLNWTEQNRLHMQCTAKSLQHRMKWFHFRLNFRLPKWTGVQQTGHKAHFRHFVSFEAFTSNRNGHQPRIWISKQTKNSVYSRMNLVSLVPWIVSETKSLRVTSKMVWIWTLKWFHWDTFEWIKKVKKRSKIEKYTKWFHTIYVQREPKMIEERMG